MQDMIPRSDRSIRNIPIPSGHRRAPVHEQEEEFESMSPPPPYRHHRRRSRGWFLWAAVGVVVLCAVLGLLLSTLFAGAKITVHARAAEVTPPATMDAKINPAAGELGYTAMTVTRAATTSVTATGVKPVSRPASGVITIYNSFGTESQRLIANTRFEAQDGKIYRIRDSITVPGAIKAANGTLTPGSISATVYADSPGVEYNRTETRFTIPGFKGDPRYTAFYAEGKAITGGFVGSEPAVAASDLAKAQALLRSELEKGINAAITSQIPEGFTPVAGAFDVTYSDIAQTAGAGNSATLSQSATASAAIVRVGDVAAAIARKVVEGYKGEAVTLKEPSALTITTATTTKPVGLLSLRLSGSVTLLWQYDAEALKQALIGKEKSSFESILNGFEPAITGAEAEVRPFWKSAFPSNAEKITILAGEAQ